MTRIAIVGVGSRGLGVLERLVNWHLAAGPAGPLAPVVVHLVEPRPPGPGLHSSDQPEYLLLNTVCSQLTAFADERMVSGPTPLSGPSLYDWCRSHDLCLAADGYTVREGVGREIQPNDFLPRRLLGEYLAWAAERIMAAAPQSVRIVRHRQMAVDVEPGQAMGEAVILADGTRLSVDAVFLTVGHHGFYLPSDPSAEKILIRRAYPLPGSLDEIAPGERVAVMGMGLTAMDVIASLTLGRGGRHEPMPEGVRYVPSGAEPSIVLTSRSGEAARSRPRLNPGRKRLPPLVFTADRIERLRTEAPGGRLNFLKDVLPLVEIEIELAYHRMVLAKAVGGLESAHTRLAERLEHVGAEQLTAELAGQLGPCPLRGIISVRKTPTSWVDRHDYTGWFLAQVAEDLAEADAGLGVSPVKEAIEILRDHRDVLRAVIDPPGLDEESLDYFFGEFTQLVNRLVIGPQLDRSVELMALAKAGIVRLGPGPCPKITPPIDGRPWVLESTCLAVTERVEVDRVVMAHVSEPRADRVAGSLLSGLIKTGRLRPLDLGDGGIAGVRVTREGHPVDAEGAERRTLFLLGPHTEGSSYYNHYVPSPGQSCRALQDAELALSTLFSQEGTI
ncbi:FAD/NAD(P)-binding protein [Sphaerimonospora cavernae]|uniref:FAD/NAD(P)-binding protein n=1 Tax=Sphaerimonospora cavernae TaxID=1740611 RepID=A0ABV6U0B5_9ACTN